MSEKKIEAVNGHTLQKVFLSVEDHIAVMTLHNPPVNAADGVVQEEILLLCDYINHEDDIWVCIMHSDIKTFCVVQFTATAWAAACATPPVRISLSP